MQVKVNSEFCYAFWYMSSLPPEVGSICIGNDALIKTKNDTKPNENIFVMFNLFNHEDAIIAASLCESSIQRGD